MNTIVWRIRVLQSQTFPVSIVMEKRPPVSQWATAYWKAIDIVVGAQPGTEPVLMQQQGDIEQYLLPGFEVQLHKDECESYYHNLKAPNPSCYIIANKDDDGTPVPFIVSMSFDEAHAYLEGEGEVYSVAIPPELYVWTEAFVLDNYFPEKKYKRKLNNWKKDGGNIRA